MVDNKKYWKTVNRFFSDKSNNFENISLIENGNLLTDNLKLLKLLTNIFQT